MKVGSKSLFETTSELLTPVFFRGHSQTKKEKWCSKRGFLQASFNNCQITLQQGQVDYACDKAVTKTDRARQRNK